MILWSLKLWVLGVMLLVELMGARASKKSYLNRQRDQWLRDNLARTKRDLWQYENVKNNRNVNLGASQMESASFKPCPSSCTCSYDTINCNDLIDSCVECVHWRQIDFNQITHMKPHAFARFHFAPNQTTHIIIYKLLNSTVGADTFASFRLESNSHIEVTFQYNSMIKFEKRALNGLQIGHNSTLVFNFPYTTQVLFASRCFDFVHMSHQSSRLIIRILKSFSVRFTGDLPYHYHHHRNGLWNQSVPAWSLRVGQFIIDIKSTHLVKFEEFSFANLAVRQQARVYVDLELIEKLMVNREAFANLNLADGVKFVYYVKQITFIDFRAYSFSPVSVYDNSRVEIYLEELTSSLCLQRNVFSHLLLANEATFNFSVINSKNVQLMHDSFANVSMLSPRSSLLVGVYNMPSYLLLFQNENYYKRFVAERFKYLWSSSSSNGAGNHHHHHAVHHHHNHYVPAPYQAYPSENYFGTGYFNPPLNGLTGRTDDERTIKLEKFFAQNKQSYSYNFSIETRCFSNMSTAASNVWLVADNVYTMLVDNGIFNTTAGVKLHLVVNARHLVLSKNSLDHLSQVDVEFIREPKVFKFGLAPTGRTSSGQRVIKLLGLGLDSDRDDDIINGHVNFADDEEQKIGSSLDEQGTIGGEIQNLDFNQFVNSLPRPTQIDGLCELSSIPVEDTRIQLAYRQQTSKPERRRCSCQSIYLLVNQLDKYADLSSLLAANILPCKLTNFNLINTCMRQQTVKCSKSRTKSFADGYTKFWEYCISEPEPSFKNNLFAPNQQLPGGGESPPIDGSPVGDGGYYYNNFDPSLFSSSLSLSSSSFYDQAPFEPGGQFIKPDLMPGSSSANSNFSQSDASNGINNTNGNTNGSSNVAKIIGIIIICSVFSIILFMITINLIQYKFRDDLIDDLEYSCPNGAGASVAGPNPNSSSGASSTNGDRKSCDTSRGAYRMDASNCLDQLESNLSTHDELECLKQKRKNSKNRLPSLMERSSSSYDDEENNDKFAYRRENEPMNEDDQDDEDEDEDELERRSDWRQEEDEDAGYDYYEDENYPENAPDHPENGDVDDDDDDDYYHYADRRIKKKENELSGQSSGISSNSNSDQTIMPSSNLPTPSPKAANAKTLTTTTEQPKNLKHLKC